MVGGGIVPEEEERRQAPGAANAGNDEDVKDLLQHRQWRETEFAIKV